MNRDPCPAVAPAEASIAARTEPRLDLMGGLPLQRPLPDLPRQAISPSLGRSAKALARLSPSVLIASLLRRNQGREASLSRTNSTSNMFAMLNSDAAAEPPASGKSSRPPSRKPSATSASPAARTPRSAQEIDPTSTDETRSWRSKVEEENAAPSDTSEDETEPSLTEDQRTRRLLKILRNLGYPQPRRG